LEWYVSLNKWNYYFWTGNVSCDNSSWFKKSVCDQWVSLSQNSDKNVFLNYWYGLSIENADKIRNLIKSWKYYDFTQPFFNDSWIKRNGIDTDNRWKSYDHLLEQLGSLSAIENSYV